MPLWLGLGARWVGMEQLQGSVEEKEEGERVVEKLLGGGSRGEERKRKSSLFVALGQAMVQANNNQWPITCTNLHVSPFKQQITVFIMLGPHEVDLS